MLAGIGLGDDVKLVLGSELATGTFFQDRIWDNLGNW